MYRKVVYVYEGKVTKWDDLPFNAKNPAAIPSTYVEGLLTIIPHELLFHVFSFLSSQDRSIVCSVSKLFHEYVIRVSKSLSPVPHLYNGSNQLTKGEIKQILMSGDYHLIARLKNRKLINLQTACQGGHISVVKLMIEKGADNWNMGLEGACEGGHWPLVELMIKKGASNWNRGLRGACEGGHLSTIQLMIEKGANAWDWGLINACEGGYLSIVELMIQKGGPNYIFDWDEGLYEACKNGHPHIIELMINKGADNWNRGLLGACEGGHLSIVQLMINKGADDWNRGLEYACDCGHLLVAQLMIQKGAKKCRTCGKSIAKHRKKLSQKVIRK